MATRVEHLANQMPKEMKKLLETMARRYSKMPEMMLHMSITLLFSELKDRGGQDALVSKLGTLVALVADDPGGIALDQLMSKIEREAHVALDSFHEQQH
jgi:hypothetical protein